MAAGPPKVSVLTTTYNHETYIRQAVDSILAQETNFSYELVIGEDCSTDRTRLILDEIQTANPEIIRLLARKENWGRRRNFIDTFFSCKGQYIAILEGDDYWTSPHKLQQQADLLDHNPELSSCFHPAIKRFQADGKEKIFAPPSGKERYKLKDLLDRNFIATCAVMFRKGLFENFPTWYDQVPAGDWPLHVLNAQHGDIGYIPEVMGVHRIHEGGVWSPRKAVERLSAKISVLIALQEYLGRDYEAQIRRTIARYQLQTLWVLAKNRDMAGLRLELAAMRADGSVSLLQLARAAIIARKNRIEIDE